MSVFRRFAGTALVMSVLLVGCDRPTPSPLPSPPPSLLPSPTPSSAPPTILIPDASARRLIQLADAAQGAAREALTPARQLAMVTLPCTSAPPASEALVVERNATNMAFSLSAQPIHETVSEALTRYRSGGAAQYLSELTAALARCATDRGVTRTVAARSFAGDESVLILNTFDGGGSGQTPVPVPSSSYRAVIRAGDVVMVLDVQPLESGLTERATADAMIDAALKRAAT